MRRAEQVFKEMRRDTGVEPQEASLAIINEISAAFFNTRKGSTESWGENEVACAGIRKSGSRLKVMQGNDARIEKEGNLEWRC